MNITDFTASGSHRLKQLLHTLQHVHGFSLQLESKTRKQIEGLAGVCERNNSKIVAESKFNTWMQNPLYTRNLLIAEAAKIYLTEIAPRRKRKKVAESAEHMPSLIKKLHKLGNKMIDYSESTHPDSNRKDFDEELRNLNSISRVGEKLTEFGSAHGPRGLTEHEKDIIRMYYERVGKHIKMDEDIGTVNTINPAQAPQAQNQNQKQSNNQTQTGSNPPAAAKVPVPQGMLTITKNGATKTIPAAQLAGMQSQGWAVSMMPPGNK